MRSIPAHLLQLSLFAALLAGCNLAVDLENHPYPLPYEPLPEPDAGQADVEEEDGTRAPRIGSRLLISELMIRPGPPPDSTLELGEYIELYNAGDVAIDPRNLVIEILETNDRIYVDRLVASPEEEAVVSGLKMIEPGEFFVFVREDHDHYKITADLPDGTFYEYGRWHRSIPLSNFSRTLRLIELYGDFRTFTHHQVGWRDGFLVDLDGVSTVRLDIRQNIAFGLRPGVTDPVEARRPENWCYHLLGFGSGPLLGSPGKPTPSSCL